MAERSKVLFKLQTPLNANVLLRLLLYLSRLNSQELHSWLRGLRCSA